MLLEILVLLSFQIDPFLAAQVLSGRDVEKVIIVKIKDANLDLLSEPEFFESFVPIYTVRQISDEIRRCLKDTRSYASDETLFDEIGGCITELEKGKASDSGLTLKSGGEKIFYVRVPRRLRILGNVEEHISSHPYLVQKTEEADEEVGASFGRNFYNVSGKKAIVGLIDTGVRWNSKWISFKIKDEISPFVSNEEDDRNTSKAMMIWDQKPLRDSSVWFPKNATYPEGFTYGFECEESARRSEILPGYNRCASSDPTGHGTHIAGILTIEKDQKVGVSPNSPLIVVSTNLYEDEVVDAVRYIFREAEKLKLPAVVNISLGGHFGPHDGTSLFEILITQQLGRGRAIVAAGGNEGRDKIHIGGKFSGSLSAVVQIRDDCEIQFWFHPNSGAELEVSFRGFRAKVRKGERKILFSSANSASLIDFTSSADVPWTSLLQYSLSEHKESAVFVSLGTAGQAEITVSLPQETNFDAWISSDPSDCFFTENGDLQPNYDKTIAVPATAKDIVAVGYYIIQGDSKGRISPNSSIGSDEMMKPNITAPGYVIYSLCPNSDEHLCPGSGSSQATPYVSGAIALAFERNPELTPQEIIQYLCASAKRDEFTGQTPNKIWGCGKMRIPEFLSHVPPLLRNPEEHKISYSIGNETSFNNVFLTLKVSSDYPFRVIGPDFFDLGWSRKHKLYLKYVPDHIDVEFIDGGTRRLSVMGQGFKLEPGDCGCTATSSKMTHSAVFFIILIKTIAFIPKASYRIRKSISRKHPRSNRTT